MKSATLNAVVQTLRDANTCASIVPTANVLPERKAPRAAYVEIADYQTALFDVLFDAADQVCRVQESQRARIKDVLIGQYPECPTFAQFRSDRDALRVLALERGLVDDQYVRKAYNGAIVELWGALPVSDSPAAVAKRLQRPVKPIKADKPAKVDTPPEKRAETVPATIGQFIARFGTAAVLVELAKILATEKSTATDAATLIAVASHYKAA